MQLLVQMRDDARIQGFARKNNRRIAGQQLLQAEDQDRDEEQRRDDGRQTLNEIVAHGGFAFISLKITGLGDNCHKISVVPAKAGTQWRWTKDTGFPLGRSSKLRPAGSFSRE